MKTIGIDLGTTNSCVYYLDDTGNPVLVRPEGRYKFFPSVAWAAGPDKDIVVGHKAKTRIGEIPAPVIAIKRKMGTTETVELAGNQVGAVEVSRHILKHAKALVEQETGDAVGGVIVTVPAYFDMPPRLDTHRAALEAFFDGDAAKARGRFELLLEPEAAAYAYAARDDESKMWLLVYDLGGGTFDVTLLKKDPESGINAVKSGGDPHLGGDDVDYRLAFWFLYLLRGGRPEALRILSDPERYPAEKRYALFQQLLDNDIAALRKELRKDDLELLLPPDPPFRLNLDENEPEDLMRILFVKDLAETAKMDLTTKGETAVTRQKAFKDQEGSIVDIDLNLSRDEFNLLIGDMIGKTIKCTREVLYEAGVKADEIDKVLLVGGSSRMPVVMEKLKGIFSCPFVIDEPDLIVARGAAIRARELKVSTGSFTLDFPRETGMLEVDVRGRLGNAVAGHAYLLKDGEEVADASLDQGRFRFRSVRLSLDCENRFTIEVLDMQEALVDACEFCVRQRQGAPEIGPGGGILTKPIRALGTRGFYVLFAEGEKVPNTKKKVCYRKTRDNYIDIPFYEGDRHLATLRITEVDESLPVGEVIDLDITVNDGYQVEAHATVRATRQHQKVDFKITPLAIPPIDAMDRVWEETLLKIKNDLEKVRDRNRRSELTTRLTRLTSDYKVARHALQLNPHKLFTTLAELKTLLVDVRNAEVFMYPPYEEFQRYLGSCRRRAEGLPSDGAIRPEEFLKRLQYLENAGKTAWDREDEREWKSINSELRRQEEALARAASTGQGGESKPIEPGDLQISMLGWLKEISEKTEKKGILPQFEMEIGKLREDIRAVALNDSDGARGELWRILEERLKPLDVRVNNAIEELSKDKRDKKTTIDFETSAEIELRKDG